MAPESGTPARYLCQNVLNYTASEAHATCGHLFNPSLPEEVRTYIVSRYHTKLKYIEENLVKVRHIIQKLGR